MWAVNTGFIKSPAIPFGDLSPYAVDNHQLLPGYEKSPLVFPPEQPARVFLKRASGLLQSLQSIAGIQDQILFPPTAYLPAVFRYAPPPLPNTPNRGNPAKTPYRNAATVGAAYAGSCRLKSTVPGKGWRKAGHQMLRGLYGYRRACAKFDPNNKAAARCGPATRGPAYSCPTPDSQQSVHVSSVHFLLFPLTERIPSPVPGLFTVLNSLLRACIDTTQTLVARFAPNRPPALQRNGMGWAVLFAQSTADTVVRHKKRIGAAGKTVKPKVDHPGF